MKTKILAALLLGASALSAAPRVFIGFGFGAPYRPYYAPAPVYVAPPPVYNYAPAYAGPVYPAPYVGATWVNGYWYGSGPHRVWRNGYWARRGHRR